MPEMVASQKWTALWRNRNFLLLWAGQALSLLGDNLFAATLMLWIIEQLAQGEQWLPLATSGVALSATFPSLLLGPIAGVFVDRWERRLTMIWTDVGRFVVILLFLLITIFVADRTVLLICCFVSLLLVACGSQFFLPARVAVVADLVLEGQRPSAYGSLWQVSYLAQILGPAAAAPLYVALGPQWAIAINAASFLISFQILLLIQIPVSHQSETSPYGGFWQEFVGGWKFFVHNRILVAVTICTMLFMIGGAASNSLEYLYGEENLHIPVQLLGVYAGCYGLGIVIGLPVMAALGKQSSEEVLYWISLIANGLAMLVLSRLTSMIPGMICEVASGFVSASILLVRQPLTVLVTPRQLLGRIQALQTPMITVASLMGGFIAGILATLLTGFHAQIAGILFGRLDTILIGIGILTIGAGIYARLVLSPAVKAFRAKQKEEADRDVQSETER